MRFRIWASSLLTALAASAALAQTPTSEGEAPAAPEAAGPRLTLRGFSNVDFALHEEGRPDTSPWGSSTPS